MESKKTPGRGDIQWRHYLPRVKPTRGDHEALPWYRLKRESMEAAAVHMEAGLRDYARKAGFDMARMAFHMDVPRGSLSLILKTFPAVRTLLGTKKRGAWTAEDEEAFLKGQE